MDCLTDLIERTDCGSAHVLALVHLCNVHLHTQKEMS
jgi:hypothetical protein